MKPRILRGHKLACNIYIWFSKDIRTGEQTRNSVCSSSCTRNEKGQLSSWPRLDLALDAPVVNVIPTKFLNYLKEIYLSKLTVEKDNKSEHLADYLDLTFRIDSGGKLSIRLYDKRDDLTSTLSICHPFPAAYNLALLMVYAFSSS